MQFDTDINIGTGILYLGAIVFIVVFVYNFRSGLTDYVYLATRNWKTTIFILVCILVGVFMGAYELQLDYKGDMWSLHNSPSRKDDNAVAIRHCREFVQARLNGETTGPGDDAPEHGGWFFGPQSRWDECADLFGNNFWKYDISVGGENGGKVLCRLYRQGDYRSAGVDSWCNTAFKK
jgi:hypothetical protein